MVYDGGTISNSRNPDELKTAINEIQAYGHQGNFNLVQLKDDGYLLLRKDLISDVVVKSEELIEKILEVV